MRKRTQRSGRTFYYLDTGEKPRKEIPLGDDYIAALRKYAELHQIAKVAVPKFGDVILKYETDVMATLATSTQRTHASDMKHLHAFFKDAPLDQIRPMHIREFIERHRDKPTTANRCKRLFSTLWNHARGWGITDAEIAGIMGWRGPGAYTEATFRKIKRIIAEDRARRAPPALGADGLPALPDGDEFSATRMLPNGQLAPRFTAATLRQYAREAVAADRLARQDQQPARASVDSPDFCDLVARWAGAAHSCDKYTRTEGARDAWRALIDHINAWGGVTEDHTKPEK